MQVTPEQLADRIVQAYKSLPEDRRLLVAIAGPPGSGKSTLAYPLADYLNALILGHPPRHPAHIEQPRSAELAEPSEEQGTGDEVALCVGLDGWHFTRRELDGFEDPKEAHWRRGAAFTFNQPAYHSFLLSLREPISGSSPGPKTVANPDEDSPLGSGPNSGPNVTSRGIPFPTFDHALKDPQPSPTPILPRHRIILVEGLYTLLDRDGWRESAALMDMRVWVDVDREHARGRVVRRNFQAGVVEDLKACEERVDAVDMANGEEVRAHVVDPTYVLASIEGRPFSAHAFG